MRGRYRADTSLGHLGHLGGVMLKENPHGERREGTRTMGVVRRLAGKRQVSGRLAPAPGHEAETGQAEAQEAEGSRLGRVDHLEIERVEFAVKQLG